MAAPHVAGAAALYLAAHPSAAPNAVASGLVAAASLNKVSRLPAGTPNRLLFSGPLPLPPAAPILVAPANGATGLAVPVRLSWTAPARAASYRIQLSRTLDFAILVLYRSGVTTTSTSISGLDAATLYYWRVRATNAGGTGPWSVKRRLKTR